MTNNARKPDETIEQYHERLNQEAKVIKVKLRGGKLVWNSAHGTYKKPTDLTPEGKAAPAPQPVPNMKEISGPVLNEIQEE